MPLFLFLLYLLVGTTYGAGEDVFIKSFQNRGFETNLIKSIMLDYELLVTRSKRTDAEIKTEVDLIIGNVENIPGTSEYRQNYINNLTSVVRNKYLYGDRIKGKYISKRQQGGVTKFRQEYSRYNAESKQWSDTSVSLGNTDGYFSLCILGSSGLRGVSLVSQRFAEEDFYNYGRLLGSFSRDFFEHSAKAPTTNLDELLKEFLHNNEMQIQIKQSEEKDSKSQQLELTVSKVGKLLEKYLIDPSLGFVCPQIQLFDSKTNKLSHEFISSEYFLDSSTGFWYPKVQTISVFNTLNGEILEKSSYTFDSKTAKFNSVISDKEFSIDIPEGAIVTDARKPPRVDYTAIHSGTLSLSKVDIDLVSMNWLHKEGDIQYRGDSQETSTVRLVLISLGSILVVIGAIKMWRQRNAQV